MSTLQSTFSCDWLSDELFTSWLKPVVGNTRQARCALCSKTIQLSNMGRQALVSHQRSAAHVKRVGSVGAGQVRLSSAFAIDKTRSSQQSESVVQTSEQRSTSVDSVATRHESPIPGSSCTASGCTSSSQTAETVTSSAPVSDRCVKTMRGLDAFMSTDAVAKSEVIWAMKVVMNHLSFRSCLDLSETFRIMFPDSAIAHKFMLSKTKAAYSIVHGLAPYFRGRLEEDIKKSPVFVACFDEALNRVAQRSQMDIVIRYWSEEAQQVQSRYFTSVFLGHATAKDLETNFTEALSDLSLMKLVQVSMDGPSVNWKFLESLQTNLHPDAADPQLLDLGSCGLHVVHGAFQTGHKAAGWTVNEMLRSLYGMFKDSPARRADYTEVTGSTTFPKKFCQVRWLANADVANRAIEVLPHVKKYVESRCKFPKNFTCDTVAKACADPLAVAKLAFFASVASLFEPFLRKYQTADPLVVFLYEDVTNMLRSVLNRFVKKTIVEAAGGNASKLARIDLSSADTIVGNKDVDIGVAAHRALSASKTSDRDKLEFRMSCLAFLKATASKIVERSPLRYRMVRAVSCLSPTSIVMSRTLCETRMAQLAQNLFDSNHLPAASADQLKVQFGSLCSLAAGDLRDTFTSYNNATQRLDTFYGKLLRHREEFSDLWYTIKFVMMLSHGNACVESGFSVNSDMLVENMHEESLVAQRHVYDAVNAVGGVTNVTISRQMLQFHRGAHSRYQSAADAKKRATSEEDKKRASRKRVADEIKTLQEKKLKLKESVTQETRDIDNSITLLQKMM